MASKNKLITVKAWMDYATKWFRSGSIYSGENSDDFNVKEVMIFSLHLLKFVIALNGHVEVQASGEIVKIDGKTLPENLIQNRLSNKLVHSDHYWISILI